MSARSLPSTMSSIVNLHQLKTAFLCSLRKMNPATMVRNPVMFLVEIGSVVTAIIAIIHPTLFSWSIVIWLVATVIFANMAEAIAEERGKAQADSLRATRVHTEAYLLKDGQIETISADSLRPGDVVVVSAGQIIPADGDVIEGAASVDESAITGESAPVIRESGGDRCSVTGGTKVLSDTIHVKITSKPGESFLDKMIALVEGASRAKTPNEIALTIFLSVLTIIFLVVTATLQPIASHRHAQQPMIVLVALLVCLIPTTIGALLSAIGIAGMDRLVRRNVLAMSGRAVEAAGDVTTLLLDKTGTITMGDRQAVAFIPAPGVDEKTIATASQLSSWADETPEGRSVVDLAHRLGCPEIYADHFASAHFIPFSAVTRMSGVEMGDGRSFVKGAASEILSAARRSGCDHTIIEAVDASAQSISSSGGTALVVAEKRSSGMDLLGCIHLKDIVKPNMRERFEQLRSMGIKTVMITGDNPLTAQAIAQEAGVDDFLAEAKPEDKLALIRQEQACGRMVAMSGDGTNDAPALAQADVGVAMNTGTSAAKEAANMIDLDSDPTKVIEIVSIGKTLLMTRGALTTFSIANDVAKYFAIIPAMFMEALPQLRALNIMHLHSPQSAILSAVIFNACIIIALIPLAMKGVTITSHDASVNLRRNLLVYGLGGLIVPFIGIKIVDLILTLLTSL